MDIFEGSKNPLLLTSVAILPLLRWFLERGTKAPDQSRGFDARPVNMGACKGRAEPAAQPATPLEVGRFFVLDNRERG